VCGIVDLDQGVDTGGDLRHLASARRFSISAARASPFGGSSRRSGRGEVGKGGAARPQEKDEWGGAKIIRLSCIQSVAAWWHRCVTVWPVETLEVIKPNCVIWRHAAFGLGPGSGTWIIRPPISKKKTKNIY
jgi:hypothetical protein